MTTVKIVLPVVLIVVSQVVRILAVQVVLLDVKEAVMQDVVLPVKAHVQEQRVESDFREQLK